MDCNIYYAEYENDNAYKLAYANYVRDKPKAVGTQSLDKKSSYSVPNAVAAEYKPVERLAFAVVKSTLKVRTL